MTIPEGAVNGVVPLLSFSLFSYWFISLVRILSTILNKSGDSRQPCLIPDFNGIALSFSHLG